MTRRAILRRVELAVGIVLSFAVLVALVLAGLLGVFFEIARRAEVHS